MRATRSAGADPRGVTSMPIRGPLPDVEIPAVALAPFVLERAREFGDRPALVDGLSGRSLTYSGLEDQIRRTSAGLVERGFLRGDRLALLAPNMPEYGVAFHAATLAGGAVTTINPVFNTEEIAKQLQDAQPRILVTVPAAAEQAHRAASATGVEQIYVIGEDAFADLQDVEPLSEQVAIDPAEDLAALPYSSGTTGHPKGVMLTHRNLVANLCQAQAVIPLKPSDVVIGVLPFFHIYGMTLILNLTLRTGATIVTMPRFDLEGFLTALQEHRVTRAYVVPPILLMLAKHPRVDDFDLSSLELVTCGAAPLGAELELACAQRLRCQVCQGYGMTESSPVSHSAVHPGRALKPGTIGMPVPNLECRIVDVATGEDAERGELWMRGPNIMKGYLNNDAATRATLDADGWLRTGDVATVDADGYFSIVDRVKELIKYKGFQVAPAELEAIIIAHPEVADAAVIPIADEEAGEVPKAFVVRSGDLTDRELKAYVAQRVSTYKQIRAVEFVDEIPKSPSGKILRRVLKDREAEAATKRAAAVGR
jgi:acyl-CoA synthetase (AMP-forming)/AMP-acid ligase II